MAPFVAEATYDFLLVLHNTLQLLHSFRDIITYFRKFKKSRDSEHIRFEGNVSCVMHALVSSTPLNQSWHTST